MTKLIGYCKKIIINKIKLNNKKMSLEVINHLRVLNDL